MVERTWAVLLYQDSADAKEVVRPGSSQTRWGKAAAQHPDDWAGQGSGASQHLATVRPEEWRKLIQEEARAEVAELRVCSMAGMAAKQGARTQWKHTAGQSRDSLIQVLGLHGVWYPTECFQSVHLGPGGLTCLPTLREEGVCWSSFLGYGRGGVVVLRVVADTICTSITSSEWQHQIKCPISFVFFGEEPRPWLKAQGMVLLTA